MTVKLILRREKYELNPGITLRCAMEEISLDPASYLAVRNGQMIGEDDLLNEGDEIRLIAVISGGLTNLISSLK